MTTDHSAEDGQRRLGTSNTHDCIKATRGLTIVGFLFDALPLGRSDLSRGTKTLVFSDGTGLTFSSSGSYWPESAVDIQRAIKRMEGQLRATQENYEAVLEVAGATALFGRDAV